MKLSKSRIWTRAALLAVPVFVVQVSVSQLQSDLGFQPLSSALAQEEKKKEQRETRRTPALRNKVYEKLSEAQAAAELLHPLLSSAAPVRLLSSPLLRARETAEPLAAAMGLMPEIDGRFREISAPVPLAQRQDWLRAFMRQRWDQQGPDILAWRERIVTAVDALPANTVDYALSRHQHGGASAAQSR